jgi:hypothetical protein
MRKLWLTTLTLLLAAAASGAELTETIDRTFDVRPGATVALSNTNGAVTISAWDQPRVRVIARKRVDASAGVAKDVMRELRVDMQPRDGGLVVTTHYPRRSDGLSGILSWLSGDDVNAQVRYEVTVPRAMNLNIETVNGSVRVAGVNGRHEVETTNGRIELARCAGSLEASTTNGAITAELANVARGQALNLSTTNGRIELALPSSFAADVDAATTNGAITSDLPLLTNSLKRGSLRGSINGGGTPLRLRTTNGAITIKALR